MVLILRNKTNLKQELIKEVAGKSCSRTATLFRWEGNTGCGLKILSPSGSWIIVQHQHCAFTALEIQIYIKTYNGGTFEYN